MQNYIIMFKMHNNDLMNHLDIIVLNGIILVVKTFNLRGNFLPLKFQHFINLHWNKSMIIMNAAVIYIIMDGYSHLQ